VPNCLPCNTHSTKVLRGEQSGSGSPFSKAKAAALFHASINDYRAESWDCCGDS